MWKKPESEPLQPEVTSLAPARSAPNETRREKATIGSSITIKGELTGDEDLLIHGKVEGRVDLKKNNVTVGKSGRIKADLFGEIISVEGEVEGNLFGSEQVVVRQSGVVRGNITAPRVSLEDGSKFKGSIDMEPKNAEQPRLQAALAERFQAETPADETVAMSGDLSPVETGAVGT